jgi:DNA-binding Xre family transcriptional regulator
VIQWRLRQVMAAREIWTGTRLVELLRKKAGVELSLVSVRQLINEKPKQLRLTTLEALCVALDCSPWDIMDWSVGEALKVARERLKGDPVRLAKSKSGQAVLYPEEDF